jgi:hypothetical protein
MLVRVVAPHFVCGLVFDGDGEAARCTHAAPIMAYMVGWSRARARGWINGRKPRWRASVVAPLLRM